MCANLSDPTAATQPAGPITGVHPRRRATPCVIGALVGVLAIGCLSVVAFFSLVQRGISEVTEMGPWPATNVSAKDLVTVDLSGLGLKAGPVRNARTDEVWGGAGYADGVLVSYAADGQTVVPIGAWRYADSSAAANDFGVVQGWIAAPGNCGLSTYFYLGSSGVLHCQYLHAYEKLFRNNSWIVTIEALEGTSKSPDVLVDLVRDALAAHWKAMEKLQS